MPESSTFEGFAILELMGHRKLGGKLSEAVIGGGSFIRIDIPGPDGTVATQFYSPASVYCITPTTEEIASATARAYKPQPVTRWELPQLTAPKRESGDGSLICAVCGDEVDELFSNDDEPGVCASCDSSRQRNSDDIPF
ncbi:MAG: hypothetical protein KGL39_12205 [Patescibacteria group bacterium]|nr:hypothetical protein [Patescibacteria group bacterium]